MMKSNKPCPVSTEVGTSNSPMHTAVDKPGKAVGGINHLRKESLNVELHRSVCESSKKIAERRRCNHAEHFDGVLFLKFVGTSAIFSFIQIAIPLGSGYQISPVAFFIQQLLYIPWGVVNGSVIYRSSVPMLPRSLLWAAVIVGVISEAVLVACYISETPGAEVFMGLTRGIGLTAFTFVMLSGIFIFSILQDMKYRAALYSQEAHMNGARDSSSCRTVHFQLSPTCSRNMECGGGASGHACTGPSAPSVDNTASRRSSILRMVDLLAEAEGIPNPTVAAAGSSSSSAAAAEETVGKSSSSCSTSLIGYSCAHLNSIWRTFLVKSTNITTDKDNDNNPASNHESSAALLPIIKPVFLSIVNIADFGDELEFKVLGNASYQAIRVVIAALSRYLLFLFTEWLTLDVSSKNGPYGEVRFFIVFLLGLAVLRVFFNVVGLWVDLYKTGGLSQQYVFSMSITIYYAVFYRGLFVTIRSYGVFFSIKAIHVVWEMLSYQIRYTDMYGQYFEQLYGHIHDKMQPGLLKSISMLALGPPLNVTRQRTDIALGLRLYVMLFTSATFIMYFSFLRFGYNRQFYCLFRTISDHQYERLMIFTAISIAIELVVFMLINQFSKRGRGYSALSVWQRFLTGQFDTPWRTHNVLLILSVAHVVVNYYLARLDLSSLGNHDLGC